MSLNTPTELRKILEVPGDVTDSSLQAFLDTAYLIVTENLSSFSYSDARLKAIENFIAAHFSLLLTERGGLTMSKTGESQEAYTNLSIRAANVREGFMLTRYGQQAILLDTSGTLQNLSQNILKAQFRVLDQRC